MQHEVAFHQPNETVLAEHEFSREAGDTIVARIDVAGDRIRASVGEVSLDARDATFLAGEVSIMSDVPASFHSVRIATSAGEAERAEREVAAREAEEAALQNSNPTPVVWKTLKLGDAGVGRDSDIVLKDRYQSFWALNDRLEVLWSAQCNTGRYPYAFDVDHDGNDEVVVWDPVEMWVYTQHDNPKSEPLYSPRRNPLYNYSNYQTAVSLPPDATP